MLTQLLIRDFALVEYLELELSAGLTALTGETGAGKSILLDAIGLALGDRAEIDSIRAGAEKADIAVTFSTNDCAAARQWLQDNDLDAEDDCIIRRVISRDGRSRAYINGQPTPLQNLKTLGEHLLDIHGQHAHQSLIKREIQRELLDSYADHTPLLTAVATTYREWATVAAELDNLRRAGADRAARQDFLRYQTEELQQLGLGDDEYAALHAEHALLANAEKLIGTCRDALGFLYEDDDVSAQHQLNRAIQSLAAISHLDSRIASAAELLNSALIQVDEGTEQLRRYAENIEVDPTRLDQVQERIASAQALARKHRITPEELPGLLVQMQTELKQLDHFEENLTELEQRHTRLGKQYVDAAVKLSASRQTAAANLSNIVTEYIRQVGMPAGNFTIAAQYDANATPSATGLDAIDFLVAANPGQPARPLGKVASGGELSRISLAIQVATAGSTHIPTLIFDEVDTGIGGGVAEVVGKQLRSLGHKCQVFCVTHLHQVAAQAHHHLNVKKSTDGQQTRTQVTLLRGQQRVEEIARMFGGVEITANTLAHAQEMLDKAGQQDQLADKAAPKGKASKRKELTDS